MIPSVTFKKKNASLLYLLMMPKCSPVRCTIPALEQPVPENKKTRRKAFKRGVRCGAGQIPSEGLVRKRSYNSRVLERD